MRDSVAANAALLAAVDALTEEQRAGSLLDLFGMDLDLAGFLRLRVGEHVLHTWDITVALDPSSTIAPDRAEQVLGNLPMVAAWSGQKNDDQLSVEVRTTDPERAFHLDLGPGASAWRRGPTTPPPQPSCCSRPRRSSGWSTDGSTPSTLPATSVSGVSSSTCCVAPSPAAEPPDGG